MDNNIYIDIDSQYRNKLEHPNPYNFTINYNEDVLNTTSIIEAINPKSDSYPLKEWSWNSHPPVTIIFSHNNSGTPITSDILSILNGSTEYNSGGISNSNIISNNINIVHKVDCDSDGSGMLFYFETIPFSTTLASGTVEFNSNSIKILSYGNNYIEGETLKINRSNAYDLYNFPTLMVDIGGMKRLYDTTTSQIQVSSPHSTKSKDPSKVQQHLIPILMSKDFSVLPTGYTDNSSSSNYSDLYGTIIYNTSGGSGSGLRVILSFDDAFENDVTIELKKVDNGSGYKEGDIITILEDNSTFGSIRCMLLDYRFRIGESYSLDISNIVENNLLQVTLSTSVVYSHANLQPLQTVKTKTGSGSGMILQTMNVQIGNQTTVYLINRIVGIFDTGKNYQIGDIVTVTDRSGNSFDLTIIPPNSSKYNRNNISQIYDNGILSGNKRIEPQFLDRQLNVSEYFHTDNYGLHTRSGTTVTITKSNHNFIAGDVLNLQFYKKKLVFGQDIGFIEISTISASDSVASGIYTVATVVDANNFTIVDTVSGTISSSVIVIIKSDKQLFDLYNVKGKTSDLFGTKRYNTELGIVENETYSSINNIQGNKIYLNNSRFFGLGLYDNFYKGLFFENLTAGTKQRIIEYDHKNCIITLQNTVDNEYTDIQNFWKIENPSSSTKIFIPNGSDNVNDYVNYYYEAIVYTGQVFLPNDFLENSSNQTKLNNLSIDKRFVHQFRKITEYDHISKMITLEYPLINITSHANQFNKTPPSIIKDIRYIHYSSQTYQNGQFELEVFPFEYDLYDDMSASPTNKNASGLTISITITNGRIESITSPSSFILSNGSGYESNVESLGITSSSTSYTTQHTTGYNYTNWSSSYS